MDSPAHDTARPTTRDGLLVATLAYLLLPLVIFALGWLRPWLGVAVTLLALACIADAWRRARTGEPAPTRNAIVLILALAAFWTVATGIGGIGAQSTDYFKHNLVFDDLASRPWPVVYGNQPGAPLLNYYTAYYLPAALAGKVLGPAATDPASLAWAWIGVALAFAWFRRLGGRQGTVVLFLVLLIEGLTWAPALLRIAHHLGLVGASFGGVALSDPNLTVNFWELTGTPTRLMFPSEIDSLRWVPQHVIAAWLATACVLRTLVGGRDARHVVVAHAASVLWSPFVAVGLVPFTAAALWRRRRETTAWPIFAGGLLAIPPSLYILGHAPQRDAGLLFGILADPVVLAKFVAFLVLAVGALWAAVWLVRRRYRIPGDRWWRAISLAALVASAATLVHMGHFDDWAMRVPMPALITLRLGLAVTAVELWTRRTRRLHRIAFAVLLLLCAERTLKAWVLLPLGEGGGTARHAALASVRGPGHSLVDLPNTSDWNFTDQYLGPSDSFFARHLMARRPPAP